MKFRKKPIVIEAFKWTGDIAQVEDPEWMVEALRLNRARIVDGPKPGAYHLLIDTLEGTMLAEVGDYVIRGIKGEIYPCKPDIFLASYEAVK